MQVGAIVNETKCDPKKFFRATQTSQAPTCNSTSDSPGEKLRLMARVVLENVSKVFQGAKGEEIRAVQNVNLALEDKEFLMLVGPSGCGKTTTLRLIAGLEEVSQGTITIDN